ncbi:2-oxoacid:acceptor oxidoreductase subunit alpha [Gudongella sp. SC589]|jgi:2-oxoglutarate ferredoxin oxidoreductase subunit alpha|uniref:2-oxoacid:acceptor oxidoreductase subunit alpha n=1 Tax=Gudongella sp. SC589 TaxID=3385990 RepID=UPI00390492F8
MNYSILIGGAAGQGMDTLAQLLTKSLKRYGYFVFKHSDYMSRVRGGHNFIQIRFSDRQVYTYEEKVDIIYALNQETIELHLGRLKKDGIVLADRALSDDEGLLLLELEETAKEAGNSRAMTSVGMGAIIRLLGLKPEEALKVIETTLKDSIVEVNKEAFSKGYEMVEPRFKVEQLEEGRILIDGNTAVALGAAAAGCRYYCGYPMTPSTTVLSNMEKWSQELGIFTEQVEDEIAALNMALGASYAGVRAMTGSSGGGIALMSEALSLAGIIETPIVIINVQRPGPATGLPTRTEQADLRFAIHSGHGEFPRMVISLRSAEDAFYQTARAFNLTEKYQIPVILLSDQYLADGEITVEPFDFSSIDIERNLHEGELPEGRYKRYLLTDTGISPRIIPGKIEGKVILLDSDEHDEYGNITESASVRKSMVDKRSKKGELLEGEIQEPWIIGEEQPDNLLVCWGSLFGPVKEAVQLLQEEGFSVGALAYGDIYPFPTKLLKKGASSAKKIIDIENNSMAQLDGLMREFALIKSDEKILKYDGRAFGVDELYNRLKEVVE